MTNPVAGIRGPVVPDAATLAAAILATPPAALATYQDGLTTIAHVRALLVQRLRLAALVQERIFVRGQLATLTRLHPQLARQVRTEREP